VLGNHDWWYDAPRVAGALHAEGIATIDDDAVAVEGPARSLLGGGHQRLLGKAPHDVRQALARVGDDAPVIALTHNPTCSRTCRLG